MRVRRPLPRRIEERDKGREKSVFILHHVTFPHGTLVSLDRERNGICLCPFFALIG